MTDPALDRAVARVGDRWTLVLVDALLPGPRKYGELAAAVPAIAPNILARRLRQLEQDGLLLATPYSRRPLRLSYELTAAGRDLAHAVRALADWGARQSGLPETRHHDACGTPLEARPWCPTCERVVDDDEAGDLFHV